MVSRCRTEGFNYQITIVYLITLNLTVEKRKVAKLLDTNK